jgi:hypothetical protein
MDQAVLLAMTWDSVQPGLNVVKGGRAKAGARQRVGISPALADVLAELRVEYRRIPNAESRVFTRDGKPIRKSMLRHAFDKAVKDAKIEDFQFRDFRHCAQTRSAAAGLPLKSARSGSVTNSAESPGATSISTISRFAMPSSKCSQRFSRRFPEKSERLSRALSMTYR